MAELRLWDVLPKLGWKGEMGRVVVSKNDEGLARTPQVTGRFFWCCNRAFLSWESFKNHERSGSCKLQIEQTSDSDDEVMMTNSSPQNNILHNGRQVSNSANNGLLHTVQDNSKWVISGRKVSNLKKMDCGTSSSNVSDEQGGPLSKGERNARYNRAPPASTSSAPNVMSLMNLEKSADGMIILSCKKCNFTSGETAIISEHILDTHLKPPEQNPPDRQTAGTNENVLSNNSSTEAKGLFTCDLCNLYKTAFNGNLELHKKSAHGPNNGFACKFCACAYASKGGLTQHVNRFHKLLKTDSSRHNSSTSDTKRDSLGGSSRRDPNRATCNLCGYTSYGTSDIEKHKLTDHIPNGKFPCSLCSCVHDTRTGAMMHLNAAHKRNVNVPFSETRKVTAVVKPSAKSISVEKWVEQTLEQHQLADEQNQFADQHHQLTDEQNQFADQHHQLAEEKAVGVTRSDPEIDKFSNEKPHSTMVGPFKCLLCPKKFARKCHLVVHSRTAHRKTKTSVKKLTTKGEGDTTAHLQDRRCSLCQRIFTTAYHLAIHNATCHVHGGTYPCPTEGCKCLMGTKDGLRNHLRKCGFRDISVLNLDGKIESSELAETATVCDICGFAANNKTELNSHHKDSHVICGVECICGCTFATATELTHHKNNECQKSLGTLKIVNVVSMASPGTSKETTPMRHDAEVLAVNCSCGKGFKSRSELVKHRRECNGNKKKESDIPTQKTPNEAHIVDQPSLETEVSCLECNKFFKNEKGLVTHNALVHNVYYDQCEICGSSTPTYGVYKSHKKSCHVKDGIPCPECPCTFKGIDGLSLHFFMLHKCKLDKASLEIRCSKCDYVTFRPTEMEKHEKIGHILKPSKPPKEKKAYQCEQCAFEGTVYAIECHMKTNHVENGFKCRLCSYSFATYGGRRIHLNVIHQITADEVEDDKLLHKCQLCEFTTSNLTDFDRHSTKNHVVDGFKCDYCGNSFASESGLRGHVRTLHEKQSEIDFSKCNLCEYKTSNRKVYNSHMKVCHVEDGVQCPNCPCTMKNADSLYHHAWMLHKIRIDKNDYKVNCEYCDYKTLYPINLKFHVKSAHSVATPMKRPDDTSIVTCAICEAKVASSSMEHHISKAHVEGGHPCPYCKCSFANQPGVQRHARARHGKKLEFTKEWDTDIFVEPCTICDMRFKTKIGLKSHCVKKHGFVINLTKTIKIPTKRTCELCHAQFTETIASHLRRYHVENGFKCLHCCCTFETFANRSRHMIKAHKVLLVKNCNICGNKFLGTIKKHISKCHVDNGVPCDYCCCTFESMPGKLIHERKIHNSIRPKGSTCDLCQFTITVPLQEHMKRCHVPNGVQCSYCPCSFQTEQGKLQHLKLRHKVTVSLTPKICDLCGILPLVPMKYHLEQSHVPNGIRCSHCSCCFRSQLGKTRHLERYHNIKVKVKATPRKCTLCGITLRSPLQLHLRKHHVKNGYPCSDCSCSYLTASYRRIHMLKAHNKKDDPHPVKKGVPHCRLCGQLIHESMADHMTRNHLHTNPHKCNRCVCRFKTIIGLQQHLSKEHKGSGTSTSTIVPSKTANLEPQAKQADQLSTLEQSTSNDQTTSDSELEESIRSDCDPAVFKCSICPRKFPTKIGLKIHGKHIHSANPATAMKEKEKTEDLGDGSPTVNHSSSSDTSDMEYEDSDHSFSSSSETKLQNHKKSIPVVAKEKLTCAKCGYLATTLSQLNFHLQKSHVKNSPFPCTKCTCGFAKEEELQRHQRVLHHEL